VILLKSLSKKLIKIFGNSKLRKKFERNSFLLVRKYDIEKSISDLEEVYYSLIKKA